MSIKSFLLLETLLWVGLVAMIVLCGTYVFISYTR